jgi:hypothetical protein
MKEVGFPKADPSVEKERIVGLAGKLCHRETGGLGELIGGAHDEGFERVSLIEPDGRRGPGRLRHRNLTGARGGVDRSIDDEGDPGGPAEAIFGGRSERVQVMLLEPISRELVWDTDLEMIALHG